MMDCKYSEAVRRILSGIGIGTDGDYLQNSHVMNTVESKHYDLHGTSVSVEVCEFGSGDCRIDIDFRLPEGSVLANTFMDHCAAIEKTPRNNYGEYFAGPAYRTQSEECHFKHTFAYAPFNGTFFYVRSEHYKTSELDEAAANAIALARQFASHLNELKDLRYWNDTDPEVIAKANEIIANADLRETDCDREEKAHWLVDGNSFIRGWFMPFNDRGRGTFDTVWPSSVDYAASEMGLKGSFEYAVACRVLTDPKYIAKARKACYIREETTVTR